MEHRIILTNRIHIVLGSLFGICINVSGAISYQEAEQSKQQPKSHRCGLLIVTVASKFLESLAWPGFSS